MLSTLAATLILAPAVTVTPVRTLPTLRTIAVAAAPTGSTIAVALENHAVRIMNAATGQTLRTLSGHPQAVYGLAFSPNGRTLATADETARIWLWDVATGRKIREFPRAADLHSRGIQHLAFNANGTLLASTGRDDAIIVWNVSQAQRIAKILGQGANVASAQFNPRGGSILAATLGTGVRFWATSNWQAGARLEGHGGQGISDLAVNRAGTRMITAGRDGTAAVWDLVRRTRLNSLRGHTDMVLRCAVSPNGRLAATSSSDRTVIVWNTQTFRPVATIERQSSVGAPVAFTGNGRFLITTTDSDGLQIHAITPAQGR